MAHLVLNRPACENFTSSIFVLFTIARWGGFGRAAGRSRALPSAPLARGLLSLRLQLAQIALDRQIGRARAIVAVQDAERRLLVQRVALLGLERPEVQVPQEHVPN